MANSTDTSTPLSEYSDCVVIGAGAAGLMCAITAAQRGRTVLLLDHANKPGKKILMSGGGRCNFTNLVVEPQHYLSANPHFCKSALRRYTPADFISLVESHDIPYHEKTLGQLFCNNKSSDILNMLLNECDEAGVELRCNCDIKNIQIVNHNESSARFKLSTSLGQVQCESLVVATGGLSIPTMGASGFGYQVAQQFSLNVIDTVAALVAFTLQPAQLDKTSLLSGISVAAEVSCNNMSFREAILFTHRGLSGPAVLQISNYWQPGDEICINFLPGDDVFSLLQQAKQKTPKTKFKTWLNEKFSKRFTDIWLENFIEGVIDGNMNLADLNKNLIHAITNSLQQWRIKPSGTEGYRTAEVTRGGIDTDEISSKTFEAKQAKGLYFIGEVLDVTGWLGGYNFQWAWASGYCAGSAV